MSRESPNFPEADVHLTGKPELELPPAAVIEIIERGHRTNDTPGGSLIVPDEIRVNGTPLLVERGSIKVHEMDLGNHDAAKVTLTLLARRITIAAEGDLADGS